MWDELASRLVSYVGGSALVVTSIQAGDKSLPVPTPMDDLIEAGADVLEAGTDVVNHGGNLMRLRFADWPPLTELAGHLSMGDIFGFIGAMAVLYRLWLDIRKGR